MPLGPGKYGERAKQILEDVDGSLCVVILFGPDGPGFDVCTSDPATLMLLPSILHEMAESIAATLGQDIRDIAKTSES